MKAHRVNILSALFVFMIFFGGVWLATQMAAKWLAYQPQLGQPILALGGVKIYLPFMIFKWVFHYHAYAPKIFDQALLIASGGALLGVAVAIILAVLRSKSSKDLTSHGTAVWATKDELKKAGLLTNEGIVIGLTPDGNYIRHNGPEPTLVAAPTRSGKGVSIIIPTLLTWPHSVIITDIKGENWGITSGWRHAGLKNITMKFDPTALEGSVKFNPLSEIRIGTDYEVRDVQNIVDMIIDPQGTGSLDHWEKTGHALLVGAIMHVLYSKKYCHSLSGVAALFSDPECNFYQTLEDMKTYNHLACSGNPDAFMQIYGSGSKTHPIVAHAAQSLLNKDDKERSGVLSTALSFLELYQDPIIAKNTSCSEFSISDLMNNEKPVSLYLVIPSSDILRVTPLTRIIMNLVITRLTEKLEFKDGMPVVAYKHRLLVLFDEFPAFGKLENFEKQLSFVAGYGIKVLLIIQSLNQLFKTYQTYNSIIDNSLVRVFFTPNTDETADKVSRMLGKATELLENQSFSGNRLNPWLSHASYSTQEIGRQLMTPEEVMLLPGDEEIVFVNGIPPVKCKKIFYYKDDNFKSRLKPELAQSDICRTPQESVIEAEHSVDMRPPAAPQQTDNSYISDMDDINDLSHETHNNEFDDETERGVAL